MRPGSCQSCSSMGSGCSRAAGIAGRRSSSEAGYTTLAPGWPDDPDTVEEALANPEVFADKTVGQVADHFAGRDRQAGQEAGRDRTLLRRPADPDPGRSRPVGGGGCDRPGALPRRAAPADLGAAVGLPGAENPANRHRAVPLTYEQFRYAFANAVSEDEARELYDTFAVPAPGAPLFQAATANFNPRTEAKVDSENPDRGPLLIISGEKDHTVPPAIANASYKKQQRNPGVTEIVGDSGPRTRAHHRQRMARGRRHGARVRQAVRLARLGRCHDERRSRVRSPTPEA